MGLIWIALTHEIIDGLWFYFGSAQDFQYPFFVAESLLLFSAALVLSLRWMMLKPDPLSSQETEVDSITTTKNSQYLNT